MADSNQVDWVAKYVALADVNERLYHENRKMADLIGAIEALVDEVEAWESHPEDLPGEIRRLLDEGAPDE